MSEKKSPEPKLFSYESEICQINSLGEVYLKLYDGAIREWEKTLSSNPTEEKMARRLTNARFSVLDTINDLTKKILQDINHSH